MSNEQGVFKREKELFELFREKMEKNISIAFNVLSEGLAIWIHFDKEDHWCWRRGEQILTTIIKKLKLDKTGYKEKLNVLRYSAPCGNFTHLPLNIIFLVLNLALRFSFSMNRFKNKILSMTFNFFVYIY